MKRIERSGYLVPFVVAVLASGAAFLLMDMVLMNMQGLSLFFNP